MCSRLAWSSASPVTCARSARRGASGLRVAAQEIHLGQQEINRRECWILLFCRVEELAGRCDAIILMDQVDVAETGVVTRRVLEANSRSDYREQLEAMVAVDQALNQ